MKGRIIGFAMLIAAVAAGAFPAAGEAAFPGQNGRIAFSSNRDGDFDIYSIDPAVGEASLLQLTNVAGSDERPAYSPGGAKIAFSSTRSGNSDIWLMNSDGSNPTRLTSNPASDTRATFSPDGTKVAFASNRGGDEEVWVMDAAGSDPAQLTNAANTSANPDFSPDGSQIAFASNRDGDFEIFTMKSDGTDELPLTTDPAEDSVPSYSPDGAKIMFNSKRSDPDADLWVMNADGTVQTQVTTDPAEDAAAVFSPDGAQVAFHSRREAPTHEEIFTMGAVGAGQTALTVTADPIFNIFPDWQSLAPPAPPATPTPPAEETPPEAPPPAPADTEPPGLTLGGKKKQKLDEAIEVTASCTEDCTATGTGTLDLKPAGNRAAKSFGLTPATGRLAAGESGVLELRIAKKARKAAAKTLRGGGKVRAKTSVAVTDEAGNEASGPKAVKLKPPRSRD